MEDKVLTEDMLAAFGQFLLQAEKSGATVEKYLRDARRFAAFAGGASVCKELVMAYKKSLVGHGYAVRSVSSMLASVNSLLAFLGWTDCKVKNLKQQRRTYCAEERELTKAEYLQLLNAAKKQPRMMQHSERHGAFIDHFYPFLSLRRLRRNRSC